MAQRPDEALQWRQFMTDWQKEYEKEKEEYSNWAIREIKDELPPEVVAEVKKWWTDVEAHPFFQARPLKQQNFRREAFYSSLKKGLPEEQAKKLDVYTKGGFFRSFKWASLEKLYQTAKTVATKGPFAGASPIMEAIRGPAPGQIRPPEHIRPETVRPQNIWGELAGGLAGELPAFMGAFGAAKAVTPAKILGSKLLSQATAGGLGMAGVTLPEVQRGEVPPSELLRSGALGWTGFGPSGAITRALTAGTAATLMARPGEAQLTGIPAVDVGLPTAALFGILGGLEKVTARARAKRLPTWKLQITEDLKGYRPSPVIDHTKLPFLETIERESAEGALTYMKRHGDRMVEDLNLVGNYAEAEGLEAFIKTAEKAMKSGKPEAVPSILDAFDREVLRAQQILEGVKTSLAATNATITLTAKGKKLVAKMPGTKDIPLTESAQILKRIDEFGGIPVEHGQWSELSGLKGKTGYTERDFYLGRQMTGYGRPLQEADLTSLRMTQEDLTSALRTAMDQGLLRATPETKYIGWAPEYPRATREAVARMIQDVRNSDFPIEQQNKIIAEIQRTMEYSRYTKTVRREGRTIKYEKKTVQKVKDIDEGIADEEARLEGRREAVEEGFKSTQESARELEATVEKRIEERRAVNREDAADKEVEIWTEDKTVEQIKDPAFIERIKRRYDDKLAAGESQVSGDDMVSAVGREIARKELGISRAQDLDPKEMEQLSNQSLKDIWAGKGRKLPETESPIAMAYLFNKKGVEGSWDSVTGEIAVKDAATGHFKKISLKKLKEMPETGNETLTGEFIITPNAEPRTKMHLVMKKDGSLALKQMAAKKGRPKSVEDMTYEEVDAVLRVTRGFIIERKHADGGFFLRRIVDGKAFKASAREVQEMVDNPDPQMPVMEGDPIPLDPNSASRGSFSQMVTDPVPPEVVFQLTRWIKPFKYLMTFYEEKLKLPFHGIWRDAENTLREVALWRKDVAPRLKAISKFVNKRDARSERLYRYLASGREPEAKLNAKRTYNLTNEEVAVAEEAAKLLHETFGPEWSEYMENYVPSFEAGERVPELAAWRANGFVPTYKRLDFFLNNAVCSRMRMQMRPVYRRFEELINQVNKMNLTDHSKAKISSDIRMYRGVTEGSLSGDRAVTSDFMKLLFKHTGVDMTGGLANKLIAHSLLLTYMGTMPFRLGLVLRNLSQTLTTSYLLFGAENYRRGIARAFTKKGIALTKELGLTEMLGVPMEHFMPQAGRVQMGLRWLYQKGMYGYKGADVWNRHVTANIAWAAMERWLPKLQRQTISLRTFEKNTGLIYLDQAVRNQVKASLMVEDFQGAFKKFALNAAEDTQWIYRAGNSPLAFKKRVGRLFGQYGTWPVNFIQFFKRGLTTGDVEATSTFVRRWLMVNTGLFLASSQILGVDARRWLFGGPFTFAGGPSLQMASVALDYARGGYRRELAKGEFKHLIGAWMPGYYAIRDITRAAEEFGYGDIPLGIKRLTGMRPWEERR